MILRFLKYVLWQFFLIPRVLKFLIRLFTLSPGKLLSVLGTGSTLILCRLWPSGLVRKLGSSTLRSA